ncbi:transposase [Candidatus Uhrbacteria bacterium]|nr:transposase [Candidatus Uhrbacteria bacterium]
MTKTKVFKQYSEGFKRQVVAEYEEGTSASALCRRYGIGSVSSVTAWVKKYGIEGLGMV